MGNSYSDYASFPEDSLVVLSPAEGASDDNSANKKKDDLDKFNHPRQRREKILSALQSKTEEESSACAVDVTYKHTDASPDLALYESVHTAGLLEFLITAWQRWKALGVEGRDPSGFLNKSEEEEAVIPSLVFTNVPLPRLPVSQQGPSRHVLGQVGYYCTDTCTPIFADLQSELLADAGTIQSAIDLVLNGGALHIYALPTHPGHHGAADSFGGYCYVNHAAALAKALSNDNDNTTEQSNNPQRVAVLDVDYHCGNGTASIFENDDSVLVVSLHCDPDYDYPFHSGFATEGGEAENDEAKAKEKALSSTVHLPMPPGTVWKDYKVALAKGLEKIQKFDPHAVIVSLGLDTYDKDPCALRRAGFCLSGQDYVEMGRMIGQQVSIDKPIVFVQEGGYRMDKIGEAAADVVLSCCEARNNGDSGDAATESA